MHKDELSCVFFPETLKKKGVWTQIQLQFNVLLSSQLLMQIKKDYPSSQGKSKPIIIIKKKEEKTQGMLGQRHKVDELAKAKGKTQAQVHKEGKVKRHR